MALRARKMTSTDNARLPENEKSANAIRSDVLLEYATEKIVDRKLQVTVAEAVIVTISFVQTMNAQKMENQH